MTALGTARGGWVDLRGLRTHPRAIITMALAVALASCGGSETAETVASDGATTTVAAEVPTTAAQPAQEPATTTSAAGAEQPAASVEVSEATVTVGDETYMFGATGFITERCNPDFFGGAQVILQLLDIGGEPLTVGEQLVFLDLALIPNDPSSTALKVPTPEPDREWIADTESQLVSGTSVDDWSIDGNRIQGTATFASTAGEGPVPGSFEVNCAEE